MPCMSSQLSVLIVDGEADRSMAVIHCLAQQCGVEIHVMANARSCLARLSHRCRSFHVWSGQEADRVDALLTVAQRIGAKVALPILEPAIAFCARNHTRLSTVVSLPNLPNPLEIANAGDKGRLAGLMRGSGIPHPHTVDADSMDVNQVPYPLLLKPTSSSGGHGIECIRNANELKAALDRLGNRRSGYIVQKFVPGRDLGCNVLCSDGQILASTIQRSNHRERRSFAPGSSIEFIDHPAALDIASRLVAALGWSGVANIDMREDDVGNVYVLEVNPRYWSTVLGSLYAGVNFPYLQCRSAVGLGFDPPRPRSANFHCAHVSGRKSTMERSAPAGSVWRYTVVDPMPEISRQLRRMRQSV